MDFDQYKKAIHRFEEMLNPCRDDTADRTELEKDTIQDSLIKRFEYTLEVSRKSCKRYLNEEGFTEAATSSPKSIMRLAAEAGIVRSAKDWTGYINARQITSHDYSEEKADQVLAVVDDFHENAITLFQTISGES